MPRTWRYSAAVYLGLLLSGVLQSAGLYATSTVPAEGGEVAPWREPALPASETEDAAGAEALVAGQPAP